MQIRSSEKEFLDLGFPHYSHEEYEDCLYKLDRIGRWLGGDRATWSALEKLEEPPQSILDVGCGGGLFTIRMAKRYPHSTVLGIDTNAEAIAFANKQLQQMVEPPSNVSFQICAQEHLEKNLNFDVVTSTLVCHHLTDTYLVEFLQQAHQVARKKVIINDLHRHSLAVFLFKIVAPICFPNRLIKHDGAVSIRRAFIYDDWQQYLKMAGFEFSRCSVSWRWAFRWLIEINKSERVS
ncbi:MAG: hypothetical protein BGO14_06920 [Chlamydiales bacterium 38-26]|nr:methyltransferase domain-containing protein [Chlamydiales bacterium]OJV08606.1 MAG: hypothetical protein BGO14_06920 [Chlamydiales bacterium 38-26]